MKNMAERYYRVLAERIQTVIVAGTMRGKREMWGRGGAGTGQRRSR